MFDLFLVGTLWALVIEATSWSDLLTHINVRAQNCTGIQAHM